MHFEFNNYFLAYHITHNNLHTWPLVAINVASSLFLSDLASHFCMKSWPTSQWFLYVVGETKQSLEEASIRECDQIN